MINKKAILTASNIKYLLAIHRLTCDNKGTRCVRIAELLSVSKPSVHTMVNTLKDMKLVQKNLSGEVFFTENGFKLAEKYSRYYQFISSLFRTYLSDEKEIRCAVCAILAEVSDEGLAQLCNSVLIKRRKESNYGDC